VIEELLETGDPPDPWADLDTEPVTLTPEQERFLGALSEQPEVPRLRQLSDEELEGEAPAPGADGERDKPEGGGSAEPGS
jgi:hypothetical protein